MESGSSPSKKAKVSRDLTDLGNFRLEKILNENLKQKFLFVKGKFKGSDDDAVILLEKTAFDTKQASLDDLFSEKTAMDEIFRNDIYGNFSSFPPPSVNGVKTTLIYPATEKHVIKYMDQDVYLINETKQMYEDITLAYIKSQQFSCQWVYNILEKKCESERIAFEDPDPDKGFILLPDMKWDGKDIKNLYLVGIVHRKDIRSIRELNSSHLPLLKNMLQQGMVAIKEKYGLSESKLRIYLHYQPSYYHLHVHFTHLKFEAPGSGVEKAHLLTDVIDNIETLSDFYQNKTLTFVLRENDTLYKCFKQKGYFQ